MQANMKVPSGLTERKKSGALSLLFFLSFYSLAFLVTLLANFSLSLVFVYSWEADCNRPDIGAVFRCFIVVFLLPPRVNRLSEAGELSIRFCFFRFFLLQSFVWLLFFGGIIDKISIVFVRLFFNVMDCHSSWLADIGWAFISLFLALSRSFAGFVCVSLPWPFSLFPFLHIDR